MEEKTRNHSEKTIKILLTTYSDFISALLYVTGGRGYTHASISVDEKEPCYYSFNYKGFCMETLEKHRHRGVSKSMVYELTVSSEAYEKIKSRLNFFIDHKKEFQYTRLGVLCCLCHIPFFWKNHYFCSQFVAELLNCPEEISLEKQPVLYLPNHFRRELEHCPRLSKICYNVV